MPQLTIVLVLALALEPKPYSPNPSAKHFQTLCLTMLKGQRFVEIDEERECNMAAAEAAADHLYNKGEGQWVEP